MKTFKDIIKKDSIRKNKNIEKQFERYFNKVSNSYIIQEKEVKVDFNYTSSDSVLEIKQKLYMFDEISNTIKNKYYDSKIAKEILENLKANKSDIFGINTESKLNEYFIDKLNIYGIDDKLIETNTFNIQKFNNIGYLKLDNFDNIQQCIKILESCDYILFDLRNHTNSNLEGIAELLKLVGYNNDVGIMENNNMYKLNIDNIKKNNIQTITDESTSSINAYIASFFENNIGVNEDNLYLKENVEIGFLKIRIPTYKILANIKPKIIIESNTIDGILYQFLEYIK